MGRTESLNLKKDYERACGWYGHFNKSEMALFSECTDRYAQKLLDTADIVREAMFRQLCSFLALFHAASGLFKGSSSSHATRMWSRNTCLLPGR
jgi:hypothetical protein